MERPELQVQLGEVLPLLEGLEEVAFGPLLCVGQRLQDAVALQERRHLVKAFLETFDGAGRAHVPSSSRRSYPTRCDTRVLEYVEEVATPRPLEPHGPLPGVPMPLTASPPLNGRSAPAEVGRLPEAGSVRLRRPRGPHSNDGRRGGAPAPLGEP